MYTNRDKGSYLLDDFLLLLVIAQWIHLIEVFYTPTRYRKIFGPWVRRCIITQLIVIVMGQIIFQRKGKRVYYCFYTFLVIIYCFKGFIYCILLYCFHSELIQSQVSMSSLFYQFNFIYMFLFSSYMLVHSMLDVIRPASFHNTYIGVQGHQPALR